MQQAESVGSSSLIEAQQSSINQKLAPLLRSFMAKLTGPDAAGSLSLPSLIALGTSLLLLVTLGIYTAATFSTSRYLHSSIHSASLFVSEVQEVRAMLEDLDTLEQRYGMRAAYPEQILVDSARDQVNARLERLEHLSSGLAHGFQTLPRLKLQTLPSLATFTQNDTSILTPDGYLSKVGNWTDADEPSLVQVSERLTNANFSALTSLDHQLVQQSRWHQNWMMVCLIVATLVSMLLIFEVAFLRRRAPPNFMSRSNTDFPSAKLADPGLRTSEKASFVSSEVVQAALAAERARIGRDIHDDLGVHLMTLKIVLKCASKSAKTHFRRAIDGQWVTLLGHVDQAMESVARVAEKLRPRVGIGMGLKAALAAHIRQFEEVTKITCDFQMDTEDLPICDAAADEVFRIVQEALTNVARHAEASSVAVRIGTEGRSLNISITDDGKGITTNNILNPLSMGLCGMSDRARGIGGELRILGRPEGGTTITLRVPEAMTS
jgi:signal transduction histidine kinase